MEVSSHSAAEIHLILFLNVSISCYSVISFSPYSNQIITVGSSCTCTILLLSYSAFGPIKEWRPRWLLHGSYFFQILSFPVFLPDASSIVSVGLTMRDYFQVSLSTATWQRKLVIWISLKFTREMWGCSRGPLLAKCLDHNSC